MSSKYLARYAEAEAARYAEQLSTRTYQHSLVIPAYGESPDFLPGLQDLVRAQGDVLVILVLNQPASASGDTNAALRDAVHEFQELEGGLYALTENSHLLLAERPQPLPDDEGVGLARKIGCDIALAVHEQGIVKSPWLHTSDADARLPADYFSSAGEINDAVAISRPFQHTAPADRTAALAIYLYELRLHYYVLGLKQAGSPYAFHTVGSCISVDAQAYAAVRGFPRRSGAEDFYLLNKLAKLGTVASPAKPVIELSGRVSARVPFGTGAAVGQLVQSHDLLAETLFYHPDSFAALGLLLGGLDGLSSGEGPQNLLGDYPVAAEVLEQLGVEKALAHCRAHSSDADAFARHFHQWFDGFRTLKFVHGMREQGYPDMDLAHSRTATHSPWPADWKFREELLEQ